MTRGVVLAFPSQQGLTRDDREGLQRFAAAFSGAQSDILIGRNRRAVALLALAGRQIWVERDGACLRAREASNGRHVATGTEIGGLLAAVQIAILPGGTAAWGTAAASDPTAACVSR